jgi:adenylate cyclase
MMDKIPNLCKKLDINIGITIGINSEPVVAGVIGENKFSYDLWGDAVNIASRLESFGNKGCINISKSTFDKVSNHFNFENPKQINAKCKGLMDNYILKM